MEAADMKKLAKLPLDRSNLESNNRSLRFIETAQFFSLKNAGFMNK